MVWSKGFRKIQVFSDCLNELTLNESCSPTHPYRTLVEYVHKIHNSGIDVKWNHIFR